MVISVKPGAAWQDGRYREAMPLKQGATQFAELNHVLSGLVDGARRALGDDFVGAYPVGSFALGDADIHSDSDFIVATSHPISPTQEAAIRRLHRGFPSGEGHWNHHLEGSYAPMDDLRRVDALGRDWLFVGTGMPRWSGHPTATHRSIGGSCAITEWC